MDLLAQRGAQPLKLDGQQHVIIYDMAATWALVQRFGVGFAFELYNVQPGDTPLQAGFELKSLDTLQFFLYTGLQAEARQKGVAIELEQLEQYMRPWYLPQIFRAVLYAVVGNIFVPEPKGKDEAASPAAQPAARKRAGKKVSTLTMRSGLPMHRSAGK